MAKWIPAGLPSVGPPLIVWGTRSSEQICHLVYLTAVLIFSARSFLLQLRDMSGKDKYSLWFSPKSSPGMALQGLVDELATAYDGPKFVPHVTLVAEIFASADELENLKVQVKRYVEQMRRFTIEFTGYGYLDEEFRSLYLLVAQSQELQLAYEMAVRLFPQVNNEHFRQMPHLSVLYGNYSAETKQQIIESHPSPVNEFLVESVDLYLTNNPVEDWQLIQAFPLKTI